MGTTTSASSRPPDQLTAQLSRWHEPTTDTRCGRSDSRTLSTQAIDESTSTLNSKKLTTLPSSLSVNSAHPALSAPSRTPATPTSSRAANQEPANGTAKFLAVGKR